MAEEDIEIRDEEEAMTLEQVLADLAPKLSDAQRAKEVEALEKMIVDGIPLKESLNISADVLEYLYGEGHRHYMIRKYTEAIRLFQLLHLLDPMDARYAFGIAASYHMLKDYIQAIPWYWVLAKIDDQSPLPPYHLSDCFLKTGEKELALAMLRQVLEKIGDNSNFDQLKERVSRMIMPLEKEVHKV